MELRPTTDWEALEPAIAAIASKASVGMEPKAHADLLWLRVGTRQLIPLAILEDGKRVGSLLYEVQKPPLGEKVFHIAGTYTDGSAAAGWLGRYLEVLLPLSASLGCGDRIHFSSPRLGWERAVRKHGFEPVAKGYLYTGGSAHG